MSNGMNAVLNPISFTNDAVLNPSSDAPPPGDGALSTR
jgi:hypothetical protein